MFLHFDNFVIKTYNKQEWIGLKCKGMWDLASRFIFVIPNSIQEKRGDSLKIHAYLTNGGEQCKQSFNLPPRSFAHSRQDMVNRYSYDR